MFNLAEYILENNYMKKVMFLSVLFGLIIFMTQCASPSRDSTTSTETKATETATESATETETETKKESSKESSDSKNTKTDLKALAKKYIPKGAEII